MEIKVGVVNSPRELTLETSQSSDEIRQAVADALKSGEPLLLTDQRRRQVLVPIDKLAYLDLGDPRERQVGFGVV